MEIMKCNNNFSTTNSRDLAPAIAADEVELACGLIERALTHFDLTAATAEPDVDVDTLGVHRRTLMRDAVKEALVAIKGDRRRRREEEDLYLSVGGGQ